MKVLSSKASRGAATHGDLSKRPIRSSSLNKRYIETCSDSCSPHNSRKGNSSDDPELCYEPSTAGSSTEASDYSDAEESDSCLSGTVSNNANNSDNVKRVKTHHTLLLSPGKQYSQAEIFNKIDAMFPDSPIKTRPRPMSQLSMASAIASSTPLPIRQILNDFPEVASSYEVLRRNKKGTLERILRCGNILYDSSEPIDSLLKKVYDLIYVQGFYNCQGWKVFKTPHNLTKRTFSMKSFSVSSASIGRQHDTEVLKEEGVMSATDVDPLEFDDKPLPIITDFSSFRPKVIVTGIKTVMNFGDEKDWNAVNEHRECT